MANNEKYEVVTDVVAIVADTAVCEAIRRSDMRWPMKMLVAIPWALQAGVNISNLLNRVCDKPDPDNEPIIEES